ncbi:unnamed protein product, partial [Pylaiella littoralis]
AECGRGSSLTEWGNTERRGGFDVKMATGMFLVARGGELLRVPESACGLIVAERFFSLCRNNRRIHRVTRPLIPSTSTFDVKTHALSYWWWCASPLFPCVFDPHYYRTAT